MQAIGVVRTVTLVCVLLGLAFPRQVSAAPLIVKDGVAMAEIVITDEPPRMTRLAARELQAYIERISGAHLAVTNRPSGDETVRIYVGRSPYTDELQIADDGLQHGAFRMVSGGDCLVLLGHDEDFDPMEPWARNHPDGKRMIEEWHAMSRGSWGNPIGGKLYRKGATRFGMRIWEFDQRGSLNAVYEFLRGLGVRWYMDGPLGEIVPKQDTIALPAIDRTVRPEFALRNMTFAEYASTPEEGILWYLRLGLNRGHEVVGPGGGISHGMRSVLGSRLLRETHPEYYALWGERRELEKKGTGAPCLSSEGLFRENVAFVRALFDVYDTPMVSVMPQDGYGHACQCPLCKGKETPERGYNGRISDYVWTYVDRVARAVYKTHPEKKISCFAYGAYALPPLNIDTLSPNLAVGIVHGRSGHFRDPAIRSKAREIQDGWLDRSSHKLLMWEHYPFTHRGTFLPVYFPHKAAEDLRRLKGRAFGEFIEVPIGPFESRGKSLHTPGFAHLNVYVTARLHWDVDRDVDALLDEYYEKFYGPAAAEMKAFVEYAEANYKRMRTEAAAIDPVLDKLYAAQERVDAESVYGQRIALVADYLRPLEDLREQLAKGREGVPEARARERNRKELRLDGIPDEPLWEGVSSYGPREVQTGEPAAFPSSFRAAWLGDAIVFGIRCREPDMEGLNDTARKDGDPDIWLGDNIEILIETQSHSYYQLTVSPGGDLVDLDRKGRAINMLWDSGATVATHTNDDAWSAEILVPVEIGDVAGDPLHDVVGRKPTRDFPWFFNVCRQRVRESGMERSAFSPTGEEGFHELLKFGKLYVQ